MDSTVRRSRGNRATGTHQTAIGRAGGQKQNTKVMWGSERGQVIERATGERVRQLGSRGGGVGGRRKARPRW